MQSSHICDTNNDLCVRECVCVCDAVIFYSVVLALDMFSLNWSVEKHMWEWFPFTSDTLVTDWTDCSHCCLNVTLHLYSPWQKPHMLFLYIKQKQRGPVCVTAFFHFSFAYVNTALCWGKYHFSRMYVGVIFFFFFWCPHFWRSSQWEWHTRSLLVDTESGAAETPLMRPT